MSAVGATDRRTWVIVVAGLLALVLGLILQAAGGGPTPLVVAGGVFGVLAVRQRTTWQLAVSAVVLIGLLLMLLSSLVFAKVGIAIATGNSVLLTAAGLVALGSLIRGGSIGVPTRSGVLLGVASLVPSTVMVVAYAVINAFATSPKLGWVMQNDAAWNLATTRSLLGDGGFDPSAHPSVAPGTSVVMAAFLAPGRGGIEPGRLLEHDVSALAVALIVLTAAASVLHGLAAASFVSARFAVSRAALALVAASLPWTWAVFGLAVRYGFWNSVLASGILPAVWLAWKSAEQWPRVSSAVLAGAGTTVLAVWAPLVLVPGVLGVGVVARHWRTHLRMRGLALVAWLMPLVVMVAWYQLIMAPIASENAGGLGLDGAFFVFGMSGAVISLVLAGAVAAIVGATRNRWWDAVGVILVVGAGLGGMLLLVLQRRGASSGLWGYYPAKFSWLLILLAIPLVVGLSGSLSSAAADSRLRRAGLVVASSVLPIAMVASIPPADLKVPTTEDPYLQPAPDWRATSILPIVSLARANGMSNYDPTAQSLFGIAEPGERRLFFRYFADPAREAWTSFWLLQLGARDSGDPIRKYAYSGIPNVATLCAVTADWTGPVTVTTRDARLRARVTRVCPEEQIRVDLR